MSSLHEIWVRRCPFYLSFKQTLKQSNPESWFLLESFLQRSCEVIRKADFAWCQWECLFFFLFDHNKYFGVAELSCGVVSRGHQCEETSLTLRGWLFSWRSCPFSTTVELLLLSRLDRAPTRVKLQSHTDRKMIQNIQRETNVCPAAQNPSFISGFVLFADVLSLMGWVSLTKQNAMCSQPLCVKT